MEKYNIIIKGGGIFSKMMLGAQTAKHLNINIENCYFTIDGYAENPLDYIIDQKLSSDHIPIHQTHYHQYSSTNQIHLNNNFDGLHRIATSLNYRKEFLDLVDAESKKLMINNDTIGVHVRLTDMNIHHPEYGIIHYEDYLTSIKNIMSEKSNLFIASDNNESILKLKHTFGDKIKYVENMIRAEMENENTVPFQYDNMTNKDFWVQSFLDMMLLSKCTTLICRTSSLSNMSIMTSKTLRNIIMM